MACQKGQKQRFEWRGPQKKGHRALVEGVPELFLQGKVVKITAHSVMDKFRAHIGQREICFFNILAVSRPHDGTEKKNNCTEECKSRVIKAKLNARAHSLRRATGHMMSAW